MVNARAQGQRRLYQALAAGPHGSLVTSMCACVSRSSSRGVARRAESLTRQGKCCAQARVAPAGVKGARRFVRRSQNLPFKQHTAGRGRSTVSLFIVKRNPKSATVHVTSNLTAHALNVDEKKLITQFSCKSRDKSSESN
jgi:hypothetical protein